MSHLSLQESSDSPNITTYNISSLMLSPYSVYSCVAVREAQMPGPTWLETTTPRWPPRHATSPTTPKRQKTPGANLGCLTTLSTNNSPFQHRKGPQTSNTNPLRWPRPSQQSLLLEKDQVLSPRLPHFHPRLNGLIPLARAIFLSSYESMWPTSNLHLQASSQSPPNPLKKNKTNKKGK